MYDYWACRDVGKWCQELTQEKQWNDLVGKKDILRVYAGSGGSNSGVFMGLS